MYELLPYLWILFMVGLVVSTIVAAIMSRPKKSPKTEARQGGEIADPLQDVSEPVLDFGDELAQSNR